jgi:hypothetical protein
MAQKANSEQLHDAPQCRELPVRVEDGRTEKYKYGLRLDEGTVWMDRQLVTLVHHHPALQWNLIYLGNRITISSPTLRVVSNNTYLADNRLS